MWIRVLVTATTGIPHQFSRFIDPWVALTCDDHGVVTVLLRLYDGVTGLSFDVQRFVIPAVGRITKTESFDVYVHRDG